MYRYERQYTGPIEAIIMDWAGTTIDFGSLAPIRGFQGLFAAQGISISEAEARGPMGTEKREHIRLLCQHPRIRAAWIEIKGSAPSAADIDAMYEAFIPIQIEAIAETAVLIPGLLESIEWARNQGIKIGANTGYAEVMVEGLVARAAEQGYKPDSIVCATQVPKGRPYPYMCLKNAMELGVMNLAACVKIDDTIPGIDEGLNAGMWTIGLAVSGNEVGLSLAQWQALNEAEKDLYRAKAYDRFNRAGTHYVVDSIADIVPCLKDIQARLSVGEKP